MKDDVIWCNTVDEVNVQENKTKKADWDKMVSFRQLGTVINHLNIEYDIPNLLIATKNL